MGDHTGKLRSYLSSMGIHEEDAQQFFHILQSASMREDVRGVEISHFVGGVMKLRSDVQNLDMQTLIVEMKIVHKKVNELHRELRKAETHFPNTRPETKQVKSRGK